MLKIEKNYIKKSLEGVKDYVDEIIITDTGSTDNTLEIIKNYTNNIYSYKWNGSFSNARNYCKSKANGDYIIWLDSDEYFTKTDIIKLIEIINKNDYDFYEFKRKNISNNQEFSSDYVQRVYKNLEKLKFIGVIHEMIPEKLNGLNIENITLYHNKNIAKDKQWYNIDFYIKLFSIDKYNSNVQLQVLKYFLYGNDIKNFNIYLEKITFIHYKFIDLFKIEVRKYLVEKNLENEIKNLLK